MGRDFAIGWLIGYFVILFPIYYAMNGTLARGLLCGIVGLLWLIAILLWEDKK